MEVFQTTFFGKMLWGRQRQVVHYGTVGYWNLSIFSPSRCSHCHTVFIMIWKFWCCHMLIWSHTNQITRWHCYMLILSHADTITLTLSRLHRPDYTLSHVDTVAHWHCHTLTVTHWPYYTQTQSHAVTHCHCHMPNHLANWQSSWSRLCALLALRIYGSPWLLKLVS